MRFLRPAGLGLAALLIGFNGAALLLVLLHVLGGPDWIGHLGPIGIATSMPVFVWLMRRSRRKRKQWAGEVAAGKPPRVASIAVCGALAAVLGGALLLVGLRATPVEMETASPGAIIFLAGLRAVWTAFERRREALERMKRTGPGSLAGK